MSNRKVKLESHRQPTLVVTAAQAAEYEASHREAYERALGIVKRAKTGELYYPPTDAQVDEPAEDNLVSLAEHTPIRQGWEAARARRQEQDQALLNERRARVYAQTGSVALQT